MSWKGEPSIAYFPYPTAPWQMHVSHFTISADWTHSNIFCAFFIRMDTKFPTFRTRPRRSRASGTHNVICNFHILLTTFCTFFRFCERFVLIVLYFPFNNLQTFHTKAARVDFILSQSCTCSIRFPCSVILVLLRARSFAVTFLAAHNA